MRHRKPKTCPFCGSKNVLVRYAGWATYACLCSDCLAEGPLSRGCASTNEDEKAAIHAVTLWNKRAGNSPEKSK